MAYILGGLTVAAAFGFSPLGVLAFMLVDTRLVGFFEELAFRRVVTQGFRHVVSTRPLVLITVLAFGAVGGMNVLVTGVLKPALVQFCAALLRGIVFIDVRLCTGSLWPSIVIHAVRDYATFTLASSVANPATGGDAAGTRSALMSFFPILLLSPNAIFELWLMRRIGQTHGNPRA